MAYGDRPRQMRRDRAVRLPQQQHRAFFADVQTAEAADTPRERAGLGIDVVPSIGHGDPLFIHQHLG